MKKTLAVVAAGTAGVVMLSGFRGGCGHRPHGHDPAEVAAFVSDRVDDALDDVDATEAQRAQIHAVKDRLLARAQTLRDGHRAVRDEVLAQWKSDAPDRARLQALVDQRVEATRAFAQEAIDAGVEVHAILTPEQRAMVTRKIERRMER
jgi:Spy/CpxP family protein refolding chaperone